MERLVNLTPHDIVFVREDGANEVLPASGQLARVSSTTSVVGEFAGVRLVHNEFGQVEGLPAPEEGVGYIVSAMVVSALKAAGVSRSDVFVPSEQVRDENGRIIGCRSIAQ